MAPTELHHQLTSKIEELQAMIESLTSQLNEANDRLSICSSLNQQLEINYKNQRKLKRGSWKEEVEKRNKLLSGDHDALSNTSFEQCDELILTSHHNQDKLLQRRVSNET